MSQIFGATASKGIVWIKNMRLINKQTHKKSLFEKGTVMNLALKKELQYVRKRIKETQMIEMKERKREKKKEKYFRIFHISKNKSKPKKQKKLFLFSFFD